MSYPQKDLLILIFHKRLNKPQCYGENGRTGLTEKNAMISLGLEPMAFQLVA
jgi:hypothetical protein